MGLDIDTVLVPVDASERGREALECAVAVAQRYGAAVHALHIVDEPVARALDAGEVDPSVVSEEHREVMDAADERADGVSITHSTAVGFSPSRLSQHPGSVVLDVAEDLAADFIVVPRESSENPEETIGKSGLYVIQYASQPVLSV